MNGIDGWSCGLSDGMGVEGCAHLFSAIFLYQEMLNFDTN